MKYKQIDTAPLPERKQLSLVSCERAGSTPDANLLTGGRTLAVHPLKLFF